MNTDKQTPSPHFPAAPVDAVASSLQAFVRTETSGGVALLLATAVALILANTPLAPVFEAIWSTPVGFSIGDAVWEHSLRHWINDGLVTLFFFVVGLEIKREIAAGELSKPRALALPLAAALGGMAVPAAVYVALTWGNPDAIAGWGVVMATDIAFVVGCLALLGNRIPKSLRVFMLSLAIIDDIGAVLVIAVGYSAGVDWPMLLLAFSGLSVVVLLHWLGVRPLLAYWIVGLATWAAFHESGIHPTMAGIVLGLLTPVTPWVGINRLDGFMDAAHREDHPERGSGDTAKTAAHERLARAAKESMSPQQRLEHDLHPWSAFLVLPLFALANAGVTLSFDRLFDPVAIATAAGLVIGKPLGVFGFAWLATIVGLARKPDDVSWAMLFGASLLAGIGFTMAIFVSQIALTGDPLEAAKLGILLASLVSAGLGLTALVFLGPRRTTPI